MSSQPHLQIYAGPTTPDEGRSFTLFPQLPIEIRLKIWRQLLERPRIVKVYIYGQFGDKTYYRVFVDERRVHNKLLRVNTESRNAALRFYRVHIPCTFTKEGIESDPSTPQKGYLYFNPEYDFLHAVSRHVFDCVLVNFLCDLKTTYDPRHVGLLNLALDDREVQMLDLRFKPLDAEAGEAFTRVITQLREVFFVTKTVVGRHVPRLLSRPIPHDLFIRSYPITAKTATFERLPRDPRDITQDLRQILMLSFNPHDMFHRWIQLLDRWQISPTKISYRLLLTSQPHCRQYRHIHDQDSANAWLQKEDDLWREALNQQPFEAGSQSRNRDQAVKPAIGFWLFHIDALGAFPDGGRPPYETYMLDLTEHTPELALFNI